MLGLSEETGRGLVRRYGDRALDVLDVAHTEDLTGPLVVGFEPLAAEAVYTARAEMTTHLNDLLMRRTRLGLIDREAGVGKGSGASDVLGGEYGWSRRERRRQVDAHRAEVERERGIPLEPFATPAAAASDADTG